MTKEESIALAIKLQKDFTAKSTLENQIESNKKAIDTPAEIKVKKRSFFRFFWPVIPLSVAAYYFGDIIIDSLIFRLNDHQLLWAINIKYLIIIAIIALGAVIAVVKKKNANKEYEYAVKDAEARKVQLRKDIHELEDKLKPLASELKQISMNIPSKHRNSAAMAKIKLMLQSGKAEDFDDALRKLNNEA